MLNRIWDFLAQPQGLCHASAFPRQVRLQGKLTPPNILFTHGIMQEDDYSYTHEDEPDSFSESDPSSSEIESTHSSKSFSILPFVLGLLVVLGAIIFAITR